MASSSPKGYDPWVAQVSRIERLSPDVLRAILLHLPPSCHPMAAAVCRNWHKVIRDPSFTAAIEQTYVPKIVFTTRFDPMANSAGVCNGLLCLQDMYKRVLFLVDPFKKEAAQLPQPNGQSYFYLGFDRETLKFKLLALTEHLSMDILNWPQLLDQGKPKWRNTRTYLPRSHYAKDGVIVGGKCYWLSFEFSGFDYRRLLISFDFTSEEFVVISAPGSDSRRIHYLTDLSGRLGVAVYEGEEFKVWSLKDDKKSWALEHTFIPEGYSPSTMSIMNVVGSRQKGMVIVLVRSNNESRETYWQDLITYDTSSGLIKKRTSIVTQGRGYTTGYFIRECPFLVHSLWRPKKVFPQAEKLIRIVNNQSSQQTSKMLCQKAISLCGVVKI